MAAIRRIATPRRAPNPVKPYRLPTWRAIFVTVSTKHPAVPAVSPDEVSAWAGDHRVLLIASAVGVVIVLAVLSSGRLGVGGRPVVNVLLGLAVIAGAAALYGYSGSVSGLLFGAH
jgi:hypothetical protein